VGSAGLVAAVATEPVNVGPVAAGVAPIAGAAVVVRFGDGAGVVAAQAVRVNSVPSAMAAAARRV
jgi:hypothetical protein